jgi:thiol-disulfide isomerase/thioredoxin
MVGFLRILATAVFLAASATGWAQFSHPVTVTLFWAEGCPHCEREIDFLKRLEAEESRLTVRYLEVTRSAVNRDVYRTVGARFPPDQLGVPLTVIGDRVLAGYGTDTSTGAQIRGSVAECIAYACADTVAPLLEAHSPAASPAIPATAPERSRAGPALPETLSVPLIGEVRTANLSLPALTVLLAAIDGFNPCAMWVLVFLIGLLLGLKDRLRMWVLGAAFIAASAAVYFVFMAAWLNVLLVVGAVTWVRAGVALVALGGGAYYLLEYVRNPGGVCKVTSSESRRRVFDSLRAVASEQRFWVALVGIVALAFAVNLVELICSAGIPAIYTQVLTMSDLPAWQYYAYLALYILVFMLDDLVVFVIAMKTLEVTGVAGSYSRVSHLVGGVVLLAIGTLLLFKPGWLMFG